MGAVTDQSHRPQRQRDRCAVRSHRRRPGGDAQLASSGPRLERPVRGHHGGRRGGDRRRAHARGAGAAGGDRVGGGRRLGRARRMVRRRPGSLRPLGLHRRARGGRRRGDRSRDGPQSGLRPPGPGLLRRRRAGGRARVGAVVRDRHPRAQGESQLGRRALRLPGRGGRRLHLVPRRPGGHVRRRRAGGHRPRGGLSARRGRIFAEPLLPDGGGPSRRVDDDPALGQRAPPGTPRPGRERRPRALHRHGRPGQGGDEDGDPGGARCRGRPATRSRPAP